MLTEEPILNTNQTTPINQEIVQENINEVEAAVRSKAYWFYWIAGLSIINTLMISKGTFFLMGLAISQLIDGIVVELTGNVNYFISLLVPLVFAAFGFFAAKLQRWAFIVGAIIYLFDGLMYLAFQEWLAAGFHGFVLYKLFQGYSAITEYEKMIANRDAGILS